jgi:hypothetical protein
MNKSKEDSIVDSDMEQEQKPILIPKKLLEEPVDKNSHAISRFLISIVGSNNAKLIINAIKQQDPNVAKKILYESIQEKFSSLKGLSIVAMETKFIEINIKANSIINDLIAIIPNTELLFDQLNNIKSTNPDLIEVFSTLMSENEDSPRLKFELLRELILSIIILQLEELNDPLKRVNLVKKLEKLFEKKLFEGLNAELKPLKFYGVHDTNNNCVASFDDLKKAKKFLNYYKELHTEIKIKHELLTYKDANGETVTNKLYQIINKEDYCLNTFEEYEDADQYIKNNQELHIKHHDWNTRNNNEFGNILSNGRSKEVVSLVKKLFAIESLSKSITIDATRMYNPTDGIGFMFVVENGKSRKLIEHISYLILEEFESDDKEYPKFISKDIVGTTGKRGQSDEVKFVRYIITIYKDAPPIEIMVLDRDDYLKYRLSLTQAHEKYVLKKSQFLIELLYLKEIYDTLGLNQTIKDIFEQNILNKLTEIDVVLLALNKIN